MSSRRPGARRPARRLGRRRWVRRRGLAASAEPRRPLSCRRRRSARRSTSRSPSAGAGRLGGRVKTRCRRGRQREIRLERADHLLEREQALLEPARKMVAQRLRMRVVFVDRVMELRNQPLDQRELLLGDPQSLLWLRAAPLSGRRRKRRRFPAAKSCACAGRPGPASGLPDAS